MERGGIDIEHGSGNQITINTFKQNRCGVYLWWDDDGKLLQGPWAKANDTASKDNEILGNSFDGDELGIQLRQTTGTVLTGNTFATVGREVDADEASNTIQRQGGNHILPSVPAAAILGEHHPVGARDDLRGRDHIVMTEWGPYDWQGPFLRRESAAAGEHVYRMLGPDPIVSAAVDPSGAVVLSRHDDQLVLSPAPDQDASVAPYTLTATTTAGTATVRGVLSRLKWHVHFFAWQTDPRQDVEAWHKQAAAAGADAVLDNLTLKYANGGPSQLELDPKVTAATLPTDHFGTIATTTAHLPAGHWRLHTVSDDGIRVWLDDRLVIDDWTWHAAEDQRPRLRADRGQDGRDPRRALRAGRVCGSGGGLESEK